MGSTERGMLAMRMLATIKRGLLAGAGAGVLAVLVWAAPAAAESPWWTLTSGSRPANLHAGVARNEVQEIKVNATGGDVVALEPATFAFAVFPYDATAAEAQTALEGVYGAGDVEVSGGPGDATASKPYVVTFTGALADQSVTPINTEFSGIAEFLGPYTNLAGTASVTQTVAGKADGQIIVTAENLGDGEIDGAQAPVVLSDKLHPA